MQYNAFLAAELKCALPSSQGGTKCVVHYSNTGIMTIFQGI